jgi:hypothetical protein
MFLWFIMIGCFGEGQDGCPTGLVPVPFETPKFCVHPYEAKITESNTAVSEKGSQPSIHVSLDKATATCANTKVEGQTLRLINYTEWVQAGGTGTFPFGDVYNGECVLDTPKTHGRWPDVELAGSMNGCVSPYGVYDQIGNAWEWVQLEHTANRKNWVSYVESKGHTVDVSQTGIQIDEGALAQMTFQTVCVTVKNLAIEQQRLVVNLSQPIGENCLSAGKGYLWFHQGNLNKLPEKGALLPVELWGDRIVWDKERDAENVGAKVGGSFYSGGESTLRSFWIGHIPSFDGSIGFRCVSEPL